jgi:hypothetical protein
MDNWDEFNINLDVALTSDGTLEEQQEKWAKSAEGAAKRVEESANQIYSNLLNDEVVIDFTNSIADILNVIDSVIDSLGGLGPWLLVIVGLFSK